MSLPYYKRFPRDFLEGTIGLSFEAKGAYAIVLDLIYMRDGNLPNDPRYIAGQLGCSVRKWTALLAELVEKGKLQVERGIISNFRADYLLEESRKYQDKQAEIASKPRKNNSLPQPEASQPESEPEPESIAADDKRAGATSVCEPADDWPDRPLPALIEAVASPWLDPAKSQGLVLTAGRMAGWRAAGASWEHDVVPAVSALAAKARRPISTWAYFSDAIAQSVAENRAALTIPEAHTLRATGPPGLSLSDRIAAEHAEARRRVLES